MKTIEEKKAKKETTEERYTEADLNYVRQQHYTLINYILNKNSNSWNDGGKDDEGLWNDLGEYENYLSEML